MCEKQLQDLEDLHGWKWKQVFDGGTCFVSHSPDVHCSACAPHTAKSMRGGGRGTYLGPGPLVSLPGVRGQYIFIINNLKHFGCNKMCIWLLFRFLTVVLGDRKTRVSRRISLFFSGHFYDSVHPVSGSIFT